jgi:hypothetical protein
MEVTMRSRPSRRRPAAAALIGAAALLGFAAPASAQPPAPQVVPPERSDISPDLRSIPPGTPRAPLTPREHPVRPLPPLPATRGPLAADTVLQMAPLAPINIVATSFEGLGVPGYQVSSAPSDTTGAPGHTQYVQWVNTAFAVFDKTTGAIVYGPADGRKIWTNFGGACEQDDDGDPIVLYDRRARRWLLTQFAVDSGPPYYQCVAVSRTQDATGAYARYAYRFEDFNDYPKFGIWPDGYYAAFNMFGPSSFLGAKACAFDRAKMLAGTAAPMVCFDVPAGGLLPSDLDGTQLPPAGTPNFFLNFGRDRLNLWRLKANWTQPSQSQLTGPIVIAVAPFEPACGGGTCIEQPGSGKLDSLGDRLMFRLAYRRRGSAQSLVVNHSVRVPPGNRAGVRWYEVRNPNGTPVVHQHGTYAPDQNSRWMGSAAMDKAGNIAIGYSVSGTTVGPSVRFTGRRRTDALGQLRDEAEIVAGAGAQGNKRWGDYASLNLDPSDDCTFWFTTQYLSASGSFNWKTRVARMRFGNCQ